MAATSLPSSSPVGGRQGGRRSTPRQVLEQLSAISLIRSLPPEEIQALLPHIDQVRVAAGETLVRAGDPDFSLYLLVNGEADVFGVDSSGAETPTPLRTLRGGDAFGEVALLRGLPRETTVRAKTDLELLRLPKDAFDALVSSSPRLAAAVHELADRHLALGTQPAAPHRSLLEAQAWRGTALRAMAVRSAGLKLWQVVMGGGLLVWAVLQAPALERALSEQEMALACLQLLVGVAVIQGACEAFVVGVERLGARLGWDGFTSGTVGSLVATLPEFVVIGFLVAVQPLAAFITSAVTIFNNAIAFSIYSFFLPKDHRGQFLMPASLARAGSELLVAGGGLALILGAVMVVLETRPGKSSFSGLDLLAVGLVLILIYAAYTLTLVRYYVENEEEDDLSHPPSPDRLGHATGLPAIGGMFLLGTAGAYVGGESIGAFADTALNSLGLPTIPTASALAFLAGISEYLIVWKAHRRGELGIALSNTFGGLTQVMFLLLPFALLVTGVMGLATGEPLYAIPLTLETTLLVILLFPLFFVLLEYLKEDHTLNNLDAAAMTGVYTLLLYFLFTAGS